MGSKLEESKGCQELALSSLPPRCPGLKVEGTLYAAFTLGPSDGHSHVIAVQH